MEMFPHPALQFSPSLWLKIGHGPFAGVDQSHVAHEPGVWTKGSNNLYKWRADAGRRTGSG